MGKHSNENGIAAGAGVTAVGAAGLAADSALGTLVVGKVTEMAAASYYGTVFKLGMAIGSGVIGFVGAPLLLAGGIATMIYFST